MYEDENICRLCLEDQPTVNIFSNDILNKIHNFCTIEMHENDGLPRNICFTCASMLEVIGNFKKKCEESDETLKKSLKIQSSITVDAEDPFTLVGIPIIKHETALSADEENLKDSGKEKTDTSKNLNSHKGKNCDTKLNFTLIRRKVNRIDEFQKAKSKKKPFTGVCPYCKLIFPKNKFNAHVKRHSGKQYKCDTCGKAAYNKADLRKHIKTHGEKECPCSVCGKLFKSTRDVCRHSETVHERSKSVECILCGKKLATLSSLKVHVKTHTGEKAFECEICNKRFAFKFILTHHIRTHTGEKPYECRYCDSKFSVYRTRKDHEKLHTGETPYYCSVCDKGYSQLSNLKSHFRNNHKGIEFAYKYAKGTHDLSVT